MGDRYWLWVGARLFAGVVVLAWAASYSWPGGGEKEFQKTLDAMKQVHSFRAAMTANPFGVQHNEVLWEADCNRNIYHYQMHTVQTASSVSTAQEARIEELDAGGLEYTRQMDGSWSKGQQSYRGNAAKAYCHSLAEGTDTSPFPQIATMIKRGIIQKGDKKTVNGVRCREWLVTIRGGTRGLEHDTVCLGLDDHLPYETTVDWENSRTSFSDYDTALQIDLPEAAVQPASATTGSN